MDIFLSLVKKEALHIVRDTRTMVITLVMPLVLLLLFGFAISTEVNHVKIVAVVNQHTDRTRNILQKFHVNEYFEFKGIISAVEIDNLLRAGAIDAVVSLVDENGEMRSQVVVDASDPNSAQAMTAYIQGVLNDDILHTPVLTDTLYNPRMESAYNFVPGIMGMIFILICAIMTSVSIVREKECGTMNLLLVSPIKSRTIIAGKLVPYLILSCSILSVMLLISYTVLDLPVSTNIVSVIFVSLIYIVLSLLIGLLVSAIADSQMVALIASAVVLMIPVIMLSGMIFPIDNMPVPLQAISCIIPARWYIEAMRKLMIQQLGIGHVAREVLILSVMIIIVLFLAVKKFHSRRK